MLEQTIYRIVKEAIREVLSEEKNNGTFDQTLQPVHNKPSTSKKSPDPLSIIRPSELSSILSVSTVTLWRMEQDGLLPNKIQISDRAVGWLRKDIEEWLFNRKYRS